MEQNRYSFDRQISPSYSSTFSISSPIADELYLLEAVSSNVRSQLIVIWDIRQGPIGCLEDYNRFA